MDKQAIERAMKALIQTASDLLDHVEDASLERVANECTVCRSYRQPLHDAIVNANRALQSQTEGDET